MSEYTDVHRAFLQVCANRGTLSLPQATDILYHIIRKHGGREEVAIPSDEDLHQLVAEINDKIKGVEQKLVFVHLELEVSHTEFLVIANESQSATLKHQGLYSEIECNYFKGILENLVTSDAYCLPAINVLNVAVTITASNSKKLTKQRAQDLIDDWCNVGYFVELNDVIHFGPKMIGEFSDYMRANFKENIVACYLCNQPTFKGVTCGEANCEYIIHRACLNKYQAKNKKCPKCKKVWKEAE